MDSPLSENSNKTRRKEMFTEHLKEVFVYKQTFANITFKQDGLPGA
jgi:hypothetical protein